MPEPTFAFDATNVPVRQDFTPVPPGQYRVHIKIAELTEKGNGNKQLGLTLEILDGPKKGSFIRWTINFQHTNATAQRIAQSELSSICHAIGVLKLTDKGQLYGRPFQVKVSVRKVTGDAGEADKEYNDVDAVLMQDGSPVVGTANTQQPANAAASGPPAWEQTPTSAPSTPAAAPAPSAAAPAPAPAATPAAAPAPAPAVEDTRLFYVLPPDTQTPLPVRYTQAQVVALNLDLNKVRLNAVGTQVWEDYYKVFPAAAVVAAGAPSEAPPWNW